MQSVFRPFLSLCWTASAHTQFGPETALAQHSLRPGNTSARNISARKYFGPKQLRPREYFGPLIYFGPETTLAQRIFGPLIYFGPEILQPDRLWNSVKHLIPHELLQYSSNCWGLFINNVYLQYQNHKNLGLPANTSSYLDYISYASFAGNLLWKNPKLFLYLFS